MDRSDWSRGLVAGILLCALPAALPARALGDDLFPFRAVERRLGNGLTVVAIPYDSGGDVTVLTLVRAGSRLEPAAGPTGLAHAVEHVAHRGGQRFDAGGYARALQLLGADADAMTNEDWSGFAVTVPAAGLASLLELEADRFSGLAFAASDFRLEAGAIQGERRGLAGDPAFAARERLRALAFPGGGYGHDPIGRADDVARLAEVHEAARSFHRQWYRPDNALLLVVGEVDPARVFEQAERWFGAWAGTTPPEEIAPAPAPAPARPPAGGSVAWPTPAAPVLLVAWRAPAFAEDPAGFVALEAAGELLFGPASRLARELVRARREASSIALEIEPRRDPFLLVVELRGRPGASLDGARVALHQAAAELAAAPPAAEELARVVSRRRALFRLGLDSAERTAWSLARWVHLPGGMAALESYGQALAALTPEAVQAAAQRWLVDAAPIEVGVTGPAGPAAPP